METPVKSLSVCFYLGNTNLISNIKFISGKHQLNLFQYVSIWKTPIKSLTVCFYLGNTN